MQYANRTDVVRRQSPFFINRTDEIRQSDVFLSTKLSTPRMRTMVFHHRDYYYYSCPECKSAFRFYLGKLYKNRYIDSLSVNTIIVPPHAHTHIYNMYVYKLIRALLLIDITHIYIYYYYYYSRSLQQYNNTRQMCGFSRRFVVFFFLLLRTYIIAVIAALL